MKCPNDQTEMEKGYMEESFWRKVFFNKQNSFLKKLQGPFVFAYKCPKCGKVELTTEENK